MQNLKGNVVHTRYRSPEGDWAVVVFRERNEFGQWGPEITAVGDIPYADLEEPVEMYGDWEESEKHGMQFKVESAYKPVPATLTGLQHYLANEIVGIGLSKAKLITQKFGSDTRAILDHNPLRLAEVSGITPRIAESVGEQWHEKSDSLHQNVCMYLLERGINSTWSKKLIATFGSRCLEVIQSNPYRLTQIDGIGFMKADEMAKKLGWPGNSPERTQAAFTFCLQESLEDGNVCMPEGMLIEMVKKIAKVTEEEIEKALQRAIAAEEVKREEFGDQFNMMGFLYLPALYRAEKGLGERILELNRYPHEIPAGLQNVVERVQSSMQRTFTTRQQEAIHNSFAHHVNIVTGGPGTGKTTIVEAIVQVARRLKVKCLLAAPTGRAARRLAEVALEPAVTIHRMLGYNSKRNSFTFNRSNPLDVDIILIDEVSMLELTLAHRLFDAVPDHCTVVMIGDVDQLPAVGPGMVLSDLIQSQQVSVITLDTVFRQGENSQIISNSHRIRKGESPVFPPNKEADSFLMPIPRIKKDKTKRSVEDMAWLHEKLARLVSVNLPERVKNGFAPLDPIRDIQVLAPMRKGEAGINELNKTLQQALNPHGLPFEARGRNFRVGDRVMQSKNNYELDISNGDIGFILGFDKDDQEIHIDFYGRTVVIPYREANELELAYAQTIHKAQGSEYPVVIVVVSWAHNIMLQRNLLYTANTRAKRMALFIASKGAIGKAVENCDVKKRYTFLRQRLRQGSAAAV